MGVFTCRTHWKCSYSVLAADFALEHGAHADLLEQCLDVILGVSLRPNGQHPVRLCESLCLPSVDLSSVSPGTVSDVVAIRVVGVNRSLPLHRRSCSSLYLICLLLLQRWAGNTNPPTSRLRRRHVGWRFACRYAPAAVPPRVRRVSSST